MRYAGCLMPRHFIVRGCAGGARCESARCRCCAVRQPVLRERCAGAPPTLLRDMSCLYAPSHHTRLQRRSRLLLFTARYTAMFTPHAPPWSLLARPGMPPRNHIRRQRRRLPAKKWRRCAAMPPIPAMPFQNDHATHIPVIVGNIRRPRMFILPRPAVLFSIRPNPFDHPCPAPALAKPIMPLVQDPYPPRR